MWQLAVHLGGKKVVSLVCNNQHTQNKPCMDALCHNTQNNLMVVVWLPNIEICPVWSASCTLAFAMVQIIDANMNKETSPFW